ncbi:hypothetical protein SAMN05216189_101531 [Pseudomonas delhiensis]|uniref:Uncharacterized protein n=1 Tax=Pseudomonas delhiensis TaxID=366289 RepID=A0A1G8SNA0_9PSED|nr:hypothetical protein SAMN05216189_101531 [Pseudomonas delhiensis]
MSGQDTSNHLTEVIYSLIFLHDSGSAKSNGTFDLTN